MNWGLVFVVTFANLFASKSTRAEPEEIQNSPVVHTESGAVIGKIEALPNGKSVYEYLGIPYAEPPVGGLRVEVCSSKAHQTLDGDKTSH